MNGVPRFERPVDDAPAAHLGLALLRDEDLAQVLLQSLLVHRSPSSCLPSRSSARRRRELTVPLGRSSASAISPGVYSSRYLRTTTARCSGGERGQGRNNALGVRPATLGLAGFAGPRAVQVLRLRLHCGLRAQRAGARPVDRPVDHDPVQPGAERAAAVEAIERPHRRQERLLRDVLGRGLVVNDEIRRTVGQGPVAPVESLERLPGPPLRVLDPAALVPPIRSGRSAPGRACPDPYGDALRATVGSHLNLLSGARRHGR